MPVLTHSGFYKLDDATLFDVADQPCAVLEVDVYENQSVMSVNTTDNTPVIYTDDESPAGELQHMWLMYATASSGCPGAVFNRKLFPCGIVTADYDDTVSVMSAVDITVTPHQPIVITP